MPYPAALTRVVAQGELGRTEDDVEIWTCSLTLAGQAASYALALPGVWTAWAGYISGATGSFHNNVRLTEVMAAGLNPDGTLVGGSYERYAEAPVSGSVGAPYSPFQQSLCITLDAQGVSRGRFGRFYPPPQSIALTSGNTLVPEATAIGLLLEARDMMNELVNAFDAIGPGFELVVASKAGTGSARPVVEVRAGRVLDTVRRRRNKLGEGYQTAVFP